MSLTDVTCWGIVDFVSSANRLIQGHCVPSCRVRGWGQGCAVHAPSAVAPPGRPPETRTTQVSATLPGTQPFLLPSSRLLSRGPSLCGLAASPGREQVNLGRSLHSVLEAPPAAASSPKPPAMMDTMSGFHAGPPGQVHGRGLLCPATPREQSRAQQASQGASESSTELPGPGTMGCWVLVEGSLGVSL